MVEQSRGAAGNRRSATAAANLQPQSSPPSRPRGVVIGGGFAGLETAKRLSGAGADITLIDRRNHHLFQPLLYQVATAVLSPADIASPIRRILRRQRDVTV